MAEPIRVEVVRYRCPHCPRTHSSRSRAGEHMSRCWWNPQARGCKTCAHFAPFFADIAESCEVGVDLRVYEETVIGFPNPRRVLTPTGRTQPVVGCEKWEAAS